MPCKINGFRNFEFLIRIYKICFPILQMGKQIFTISII